MSRKWRSGSHYSLFARPISSGEFPKLVEAMKEDGLSCIFTNNHHGYQWYLGDYRLQAKSLKEVWGLADSQYTRLMNWIYSNNPFGSES